jgi:azurin
VKTKQLILASILGLALVVGLRAETPIKTVSISAYDTMKYSVTQIEAHPGQKVVVELRNDGTIPKEVMGHNWILLKPGADSAAYAQAAMTAKAENYEPRSLADKILAAIPLLGPKESGRASFTAPQAPGNYPFFCSAPGHFAAGMKGMLVVK